MGIRMASPDILTLSSSPPRVFRAFHIPSSPALGSPDTSPKVNLAGKFNYEEDRIAGNYSALLATSALSPLLADNLQSASTGLSHTLQTTNSGMGQPKGWKYINKLSTTKSDSVQLEGGKDGTKKKVSGKGDSTEAKKPRRKKADGEPTDTSTEVGKKARKSQSTKLDDNKGGDRTKEKAVRKSRAKKAAGEVQAKLPKAQVTKNSAASNSKSKKPDLVSKHFSAAVDLSKTSDDSYRSGLLEAVKRRTCWTPPKPSSKTTTTLNDNFRVVDSTSSPAGCADLDQTSGGFSGFLDSFAFTGLQAPSEKKSSETVTKKRKLIELVTANVSTSKSEIVAAKSKAPKKKARTITDQATSAYNHDEALSNETAKDSFKVPSKPRSKSSAKISSKRGKGTAQAPILLSPESALNQVGNQDFVFGTSSQLAREESPTFLRDIHAAMQASNEVDELDPFIDVLPVSDVASISSRKDGVSPAKRNLWSAAARDTGGQLSNVEMVDLSNSPEITDIQAPVGVKADRALPADGGVWRDIEEFGVETPLPKTTANRKQAREPSPTSDLPCLSLHSARESSPSALSRELPGDSPRAAHIASTADQPAIQSEPEKPDYSSYTSVELAKEIASYRFKPIKNRNHMISLLERCWEGKRRTALGSLEANAMVHTSSSQLSKPCSDKSGFPKRPTGQSRMASTASSSTSNENKSSTKATSAAASSKPGDSTAPQKQITRRRKGVQEPVDEISDSDGPFTPSPPRRRPSQIQTTPLPLMASTVAEDNPALSPTSAQIRLFEHITRAVTSVPPSKDPSNPSWHEKILLYDPIILEDLTIWLNTGALEKAGWDGEVHPGEVKKWCVSKSICCLWKENLRGEARTRF